MSSTPSQFLQVRDLPPEFTADQIVISITKLQDVAIRRLLLLHGRESEHVPIAFIEFEDSNAAGHALALARDLPGKGFSVKGKPVGLSFIHGGVFIPVYENSESGVFKATNSSQMLAYWNHDYICTVHVPDGAIPEMESPEESRKRKDTAEHGKRKKGKPLGSGVTMKSGSGGMISHWSKKQEELNAAPNVADIAAAAVPHSPVVQGATYADHKIMACLLCSRKFKSKDELAQHEAQSDLHRNNLADTALVAKAQQRLKARSVPTPSTIDAVSSPPSTGDTREYRDRALERRIQIKQSGGTIERPTAKHKREPPVTTSPPPREDPVISVESKGSRLLSKMGYVSGGLGSAGQGRSDIIRAETYVPGAGLGSAGAKLDDRDAQARRGANTYADFVASVKERARSRYENEVDD